jgi:hypothetical protein
MSEDTEGYKVEEVEEFIRGKRTKGKVSSRWKCKRGEK